MSKSLKVKRGFVVSKSGDKTIKVSIQTKKRHPFYKKVINKTWSALVHDEENSAKVGDEVIGRVVLLKTLANFKSYFCTDNSGAKNFMHSCLWVCHASLGDKD